MEDWFGVEVTERTLRRWSARLLATDNLHKRQGRTIWRTDRHNGDVPREPVEPENADYIHYKSRQAELITEYYIWIDRISSLKSYIIYFL